MTTYNLVKREKQNRGNLKQAKYEKKLVLKMLNYLKKTKKCIQKSTINNLVLLMIAYNNASKAAQISVKYLKMRQPRYSWEDSKRLCANKVYLYWFCKIFVQGIKVGKKKIKIPYNDPYYTGNKYDLITKYYVQGIISTIDNMVIQNLMEDYEIDYNSNFSKFTKRELNKCNWANDRVIEYIKENLHLINSDIKKDKSKED